ncbi:MAG: hypothetical protein MI674_07360, partial [Cytophagales bacterium]|nr:hypothetical protein [Cytophagales bacterium]
MSLRIKTLLIVLITFLAAIGACGRKAPLVIGGQPSNREQLMVGKIIQLLTEGKSDELNEIISKPPESPGDTLSELRGAVEECLPKNSNPSKLLQEVVAHCVENNKVIPLSVILADPGAQSQLTPGNIKIFLDAAAAKGHDKAVEVILAQAQDKITATALQGTFSTAAGDDDKAPIVEALLKNKAAQQKVGDAAIANAWQKAVEGGRGKVEKAILDHWDVKTVFKKAVTDNNKTVIEGLLSNAKTKAKIDQQTIQDGLEQAAKTTPPKTAVMEAILNNLSADELGQALQKAASQGKAKVVEVILAQTQDKITATALQAA